MVGTHVKVHIKIKKKQTLAANLYLHNINSKLFLLLTISYFLDILIINT